MSRRQSDRILLVEDDPDDAELTTIALERHDLANRLVLASDGAEALELLIGEHATAFAFVMLDLKLAKVSGPQVLERVRAVDFTNSPTPSPNSGSTGRSLTNPRPESQTPPRPTRRTGRW